MISFLFFLLSVTSSVAEAARFEHTQASLGKSPNSVDEILVLKHHKHKHGEDSVCHLWNWRKKVLKLIKEIPASGLFEDLNGHTKFEISGITRYNGEYVVVFDSLQELGFLDMQLDFFSSKNTLVGHQEEQESESEYEAITVRTRKGTLLAVQEGLPDKDTGDWHPITHEWNVTFTNGTKALDLLETCTVDFILKDGEKKGFEGAQYVDAGEAGEFLLGLCEGNYCEGSHGRGDEIGHGRIVLSQYYPGTGNETCTWATKKIINVPPSADFRDYSDIAIDGDHGVVRVAITSQEDAAVWIGHMDLEVFEFVGKGTVLHFPRSGSDCLETYCNIEGVQFIDRMRIMTTTDRVKKNQPWHCAAKDQSVQIFALPENEDLDDDDSSSFGL